MSIEALSWAWEQKLKPGPKLVLLALADHADHEGVCWPGFDGLAAKTGMSRSTVIENVKQLVALELVTVEKRADSHGHRASNRYILHISKVRKSNVGNPNVGKPNVGNPDSGGNPHQQRAEAEDRHSKVRKTNVGNPDLGASKVRNPDAKVRNPDPNRQLEPSVRDTSSPNGDSVSARSKLDLSVLPADLSKSVWDDWCRHRKAKKAPINTQTVVNAIARELEEARGYGWLPDEALAEAMAAGWRGVKAVWLKNRAKENPTAAATNQSGSGNGPRVAANSNRKVAHEDFDSKQYTGTPLDELDWMRA